MYQKSANITNRQKENPFSKYFSQIKTHRLQLLTAASIIFVITGYIWFVSFGHWFAWHRTTDFYDQQATAFAHGSLSLEKEVNPALLALSDPYNPKYREGIDYPLDFSLYEGKYYLYFGPVPALFLAVFKLLGVGRIGDQYLVFIFISGIFIFQAFLILEIRRLFFTNIPDWIIPICICFSGLIAPFAWILTEARVYEVASASGQFFFLAGLYFNFRALRNDSGLPGRFWLGGILWVLSIGSRLTMALPVGIFSLIIALSSYFKLKSLSKTIFSILSLGLPLVIGMIILGWYNWARFDSPFETGWYYQLTTPYLQKYQGQLFSPLYILPNLHDYFVARPKILDVFPFLQPVRGRGNLLFPFLDLPRIYHTRAMTGIFYSTPFIFFAGITFISLFFPKMGMKDQVLPDGNRYLLNWLVLGLFGAFLCGAATIVSYFWVVTRYFIDFSPSLVLLSIIGFWIGYGFLARWSFIHKLYVIGGLGLMFSSVTISNLLAIAIHAPFYKAWNPVLWKQLSNLFAW